MMDEKLLNPREELHILIDKLTNDDIISLLHLVKRIITSDEELTQEEIQEIELAKEEIAKGEYLEMKEVKKLFDLEKHTS